MSIHSLSGSSIPNLKLLAPSFREHVMLLYNSRDDCDSAAIDVLNEALAAGHLCVYASVLNGEKSHIDKTSAHVLNYDKHIENGDLLIIDFRPFAQAAQASDFSPFNALRTQVEQMIATRVSQEKSDKVMVFAEAAGALCELGHFEKSAVLEGWWDDVHNEWIKRNLNITVICPHSATILNKQEALIARNNIAHVHTLTLELEKLQEKRKEQTEFFKPVRILIVEPEADIGSIYRRYLEKINSIQVVIVAVGTAALEHALSSREEGFDIVIIDAHLKDVPAIEVARQIIAAIPDQRIVFTTTSVYAEMRSQMRTIRLKNEEIFVKPFSMTSLLGLIRHRKQKEATYL